MFKPNLILKNKILAAVMKPELGFQYSSPIGCIGGKARQNSQLATLMPNQMDYFFEPFGGGMSTTYFLIHMGRVKSQDCYVGDRHKPIVNFHRVLRNEYERLTLRLIEARAIHGNGSYELFLQAVEIINNSSDNFDKAWAYYVFNHLSMLNLRKYGASTFANSILNNGRGITQQKVLRLPMFGALFKDVSIRERSYKYAFRQASQMNGETFLFLDPPYEGSDKQFYDVNFEFDEFAKECQLLSNNCKFMITINDSAANRIRFKKFNIFKREVYYASSNQIKPEIIICNYDPPNADCQLSLLGFERVSSYPKATTNLDFAPIELDQSPTVHIPNNGMSDSNISPNLGAVQKRSGILESAINSVDMPTSVQTILQKQGRI